MINVKLMCKKGSNACRSISENTEVVRYRGGKKHRNVEFLINYGLAGLKKERYYRLFPSARKIPTVNKNVGHSKFYAVNKAIRAGIKAPKSVTSLPKKEHPENWVEKRVHSIGGKGIRQAKGHIRIKGKYYQKMIKDRTYELRVHAFLWMDNWTIHKRLGQRNTIAWNFSNGGHFQTVYNPNSSKIFREAQEVSKKILNLFNMSFGAIDFIVSDSGGLYFIEVNSAPGFSGLSDSIYYEAFTTFTKLSKRKASSYAI